MMVRCMFLLCLTAVPAAANVAELTDETFRAQVEEGAPSTLWLIKFYAPWCGHCKQMAPVLQEFADELTGTERGAKVRVGKVDCTKHTALRDRLQIKGYPTTLLFQNGIRWEMEGPRTKAGLRRTVDTLMQPAVLTLTQDQAGQDELTELLQPEASVAFVLVKPSGTAPGSPSELMSAFYNLAVEKQLSSRFAVTASPGKLPQVAAAVSDATTLPLILKLTGGEPPRVFAPPAPDVSVADALRSWMERERYPTFSVVDRHNFHGMLSPDGVLVLAVIDPDPSCPTIKDTRDVELRCSALLSLDDAAEPAKLGGLLRRVAASHAASGGTELGGAHLLFGLLDGRKWGPYLLEMHEVERAQLPVLLLLRGGTPRSFHVEQFGRARPSRADDEASLRQLLNDAGSGVLQLEYTGVWGLPARTWKRLKAWLPAVPLEVLDFLPRYSFSAAFGLLLVALLAKLILSVPFDEPASPPDKADKAD
mmetsp:Transcript_34091/g.110126  ORF Transcript_34091/g.110126 Transcript_34091/m.110126 type:complete len:478 (-) Transcript_34091:124-1557(-)